jgi:hypothetical protein
MAMAMVMVMATATAVVMVADKDSESYLVFTWQGIFPPTQRSLDLNI